MILIVDSGSTKSDWIAIDNTINQLQEKMRTKGLNPAIISEKKLYKIIKKNKSLYKIRSKVTHVFFYGAGCGAENSKQLLLSVLAEIFIHAKIEIEEDTMAAVYATINEKDEAAIVCILGTGSNCSYYDGMQLHQRVASLGYSVMDDASGNYFGKQLLRDYYYNHMPENIKIAFAHKFDVTTDAIKENLYKKKNPNAYLASFAEFLFLHKDSEYIMNLIKEGIRSFVKNQVLQYQDVLTKVPVHFAGSIAYFLQDEIKAIAKEMNFTVGNFQRRPIEGLVKFHLDNLGEINQL